MRVAKYWQNDHVVFNAIEKNTRSNLDMDSYEISLVSGGSRAYIAVGKIHRDSEYTFTGAKALRALAHAILKEVPEPRPKKSKKKRSRR